MRSYFTARHHYPILPLYTPENPPPDFEEALSRIIMLEQSLENALEDIRSRFDPVYGTMQGCQRWKSRRHEKLQAVRYELGYLRKLYPAELRLYVAGFCKLAEVWEKQWAKDCRALLTRSLAKEMAVFQRVCDLYFHKLQKSESVRELSRLSREIEQSKNHLLRRLIYRFEKKAYMLGHDPYFARKVMSFEAQRTKEELQNTLRMTNTKLGEAQIAERELAM